MNALTAYLPPNDEGMLPYYLFFVSLAYYLFFVGVVSFGNSVQNFVTLHYTRRIYNGLFVRSRWFVTDDSVDKLVPASATGKDYEKGQDQVTPLAARVFGVWTMLAGLVRVYTSYDVGNRGLYQLSIITHAVAAAHFTSELLVFKTMRITGPQLFPLAAGFGGTVWMVWQYSHYVH